MVCFVEGYDTAIRLATQLIVLSKWFEFEPWPDDRYRFRVKDEPGVHKSYNWRLEA